MRLNHAFAVGLSIAALSITFASAQDRNQGQRGGNSQNPSQANQRQQNSGKMAVRPPVNRNPVRPPANPPTRQSNNPARYRPSQGTPYQPQTQGNSGYSGQARGNGQPYRPQPNNNPRAQQPQWNNQRPEIFRGQTPRGYQGPQPAHFPSQENFHGRPGQNIIPRNEHWVPNVGHRFNSGIYLSIDIWRSATFGNYGHTYNWVPSTWQYSVEDSLMDLVYVSERTSSTLRTSFEQQMGQTGLSSSPGGQLALDRMQRMDEAFERLRSETGSVSEEEMQASALEALACAQQVSNSFKYHPGLLRLVQYEWSDCLFECNELARYYGEPGIR